MQTITWEKKVVIVVYICHVSLLENHDLRCCIEKRDILQTSTFREMRIYVYIFIVVQRARICYANIRTDFVAIVMFSSSVVMLTSRGTRMSIVRDLIASIFRLVFFPSFFSTTFFFFLSYNNC